MCLFQLGTKMCFILQNQLLHSSCPSPKRNINYPLTRKSLFFLIPSLIFQITAQTAADIQHQEEIVVQTVEILVPRLPQIVQLLANPPAKAYLYFINRSF